MSSVSAYAAFCSTSQTIDCQSCPFLTEQQSRAPFICRAGLSKSNDNLSKPLASHGATIANPIQMSRGSISPAIATWSAAPSKTIRLKHEAHSEMTKPWRTGVGTLKLTMFNRRSNIVF